MKKRLSIVFAALMVCSVFTACGSGTNTSSTGGASSSAESSNISTEGAATAGYSVYTYLSSSADASADKDGKVEVNSYIAYTAVGEDGVVFKAGLDAAQTRIAFDKTGTISPDIDLSASVETKNETGADYGMKANSKIGKEWDEQAKAFSDWTVGKTLEDVANAAVTDGKFSDADLVTSVTVTAENFQKTMMNTDEHKLTGSVPSDAKLGLGVVTSIAKSKSATADEAGLGQVDSMFAVVALDADGKIAAVSFDSIQSKVNFTAEGAIETDLKAAVKTKREAGAEYGMKAGSAIGKEWDEQADAFAEWCIGKTPSEVASLKTKKVDDNHPQVPDEADLTSSVTISVGDFLLALEKAAANAE